MYVLVQEAVQRLFKESGQNKDEFTRWCETFLQGMEVQVDSEWLYLVSVCVRERELYRPW